MRVRAFIGTRSDVSKKEELGLVQVRARSCCRFLAVVVFGRWPNHTAVEGMESIFTQVESTTPRREDFSTTRLASEMLAWHAVVSQ